MNIHIIKKIEKLKKELSIVMNNIESYNNELEHIRRIGDTSLKEDKKRYNHLSIKIENNLDNLNKITENLKKLKSELLYGF